MADKYTSQSWDADLPVNSSTWDTGVRTISSARVTLRDQDLRPVNGIVDVPASGFSSPSAAAFAYFYCGPSRLGVSNATKSYLLEFQAEDTSGFMFTSIVGLKVRKAGS